MQKKSPKSDNRGKKNQIGSVTQKNPNQLMTRKDPNQIRDTNGPKADKGNEGFEIG